MNIKLPCDFGEQIIIETGLETLNAVMWYKWSDSIEFTYFFKAKSKWSNGEFLTVKEPDYKTYYVLPNNLLCNGFLKDIGYPIKGRGYICGIKNIGDALYAEIILTDNYYAHIYVECDNDFKYIPNGRVFVPPSWDTNEKAYSIILSQYSGIIVKTIPR